MGAEPLPEVEAAADILGAARGGARHRARRLRHGLWPAALVRRLPERLRPAREVPQVCQDVRGRLLRTGEIPIAAALGRRHVEKVRAPRHLRRKARLLQRRHQLLQPPPVFGPRLHGDLRVRQGRRRRLLHGHELPRIGIVLDIGKGADDLPVAADKGHAPADHIEALGHRVDLHPHLAGPFHL